MPDHKFCQHFNGWLYSESNFFNPRSRSPAQSLSSNNRQNGRESPQPSSSISNTRTMVPEQSSSPFYLQNARQTAPPSSRLLQTSSMEPGHFSMQTTPQSPCLSNTRLMVPVQSSPCYWQNTRETAPSTSSLSNINSMAPKRFSSPIYLQNARPTSPSTSSLSNINSMAPRQFSSPIYLQNVGPISPSTSSLSDINSMASRQFSSPIYLQNVRPTSPSTSSLSDINSMASRQFSSPIYLQNARPTSPSSSLSNINSMVPRQFSSPIYLQNARQVAPSPYGLSNTSFIVPGQFSKQTTTPSPCLSERATGSTLGDISTEILHSSFVPNDRSMLGTNWSPIEIPDSPSREKSPYQHDKSQRAKRAREEKSEIEIYSDPVNKMKKAKVMQQSQNHIIERRLHESELPSIQVDSDITNHLAACDDIQFEKDLLPEDFEVQESADGFSYDEESIDDFIGIEDIGKVAIYSVWDRLVALRNGTLL